MEAVVLTVALIALMIGGFALMARSWPRTSRLGGFRARSGARRSDDPSLTADAGRAPQEDDEVHWRWRSGRGDEPGA